MNDPINPEPEDENIEIDPHLWYTFLSAQRGDPENWQAFVDNMTAKLDITREQTEEVLDLVYAYMAEAANSN